MGRVVPRITARSSSILGEYMAKKKPVASVKPVAVPEAPVPLDWLETPKATITPVDWLSAPRVEIGQDENLAAIPRNFLDETGVLRPGDAMASKREQKMATIEAAQLAQFPKPSEPAPAPAKKRQSKQWRPNVRERAILDIPRSASLREYCQAMTERKQLREGWARPGGPKTFLDAYRTKDVRLLNLITSERKNVWRRRNRREKTGPLG